MNNSLVIVGAGEHARKVYYYATSLGLTVVAFVDDNPQLKSPIPFIPCFTRQNVMPFECGQWYVIAIGKATVRRSLQEQLKSKGWIPTSLIHPTAYVAPDADIGAGCVICAQAVVETGSKIGVGTIVDVGVIVDHDCEVGGYCHLKAGVILPAHFSVGDAQTLSVEKCNVKIHKDL